MIIQVQNQKLVEIVIDNQDKLYQHVLKKARDWELLHKRTYNIQEQSGKTLKAMTTYRAGNKNQSFQNQNQHGPNQQNRSNTLEIKDRILNQEIMDVEKKVVCRVNREIKTTQTKPVTMVVSVEGVEKIFTRNQSNALL